MNASIISMTITEKVQLGVVYEYCILAAGEACYATRNFSIGRRLGKIAVM